MSATTKAEFVTESSSVSFTVFPTSGSHNGQKDTRQHLVQYRRCHLCRPPRAIYINNSTVPLIQPGSAGPGWYISPWDNGEKNRFTEPGGVLVIATAPMAIHA